MVVCRDDNKMLIKTDNGDGAFWELNGECMRVDVNKQGTIIAIGLYHNAIFKRYGPSGGWIRMPGEALDVAINDNEDLLAIGLDDNIWKYHNTHGW